MNETRPARRRRTAGDTARLVLAASVVATVVLYMVPGGRWLIYPLMLLSTLVHELGHGVAAVLVGGRFERFLMWPDGSGVAYWSGSLGRLDVALVAAGGLLGPAVVAGVGFALARTQRGARAALAVGAGALVLALLLVVRNLFGAFFVGVLIVLCVVVARLASAAVAQLMLAFLAVQLALSVYSRGSYLFTPTAETAQGPMPSDVAQIQNALWLPYWLWGTLCAALSLAVVVLGLRAFWRA